MTTSNKRTRMNAEEECENNILNLQQWLQTHQPRDNWSGQQVQAYNDRMASLAGWIAKSKLVNR